MSRAVGYMVVAPKIIMSSPGTGFPSPSPIPVPVAWQLGIQTDRFFTSDKLELSLHTSSFIPRKTLFDFFSIPRLKSGPKKEFFSRKFSNRPPFHWNYVPYIFKKIFREFLQPPLPLIGTFSLFSYLFFLDCVPYHYLCWLGMEDVIKTTGSTKSPVAKIWQLAPILRVLVSLFCETHQI